MVIMLYHYKVSVDPASQTPHTYLRTQGKILQRMAVTFAVLWVDESQSH